MTGAYIVAVANEAATKASVEATTISMSPQKDANGDILILNTILGTFEHAAQLGFDNLKPEALWLVGVFAIINICTTWALYDGELRMSQMISQIMKICAFFFLVANMGHLHMIILQSFQKGGLLAALGPSGMNQDISPSGVFSIGMKTTSKLWDAYTDSLSIANTFKFLIILGMTVFSFFVMSIQIMITKIEFNIFAAIAVILMPFGALRFTSFLFQRAISCVFSFGIKLMVCYFMVGIVVAQSKAGAFTGDGALGSLNSSFGALIAQALGYVAIGYLVWKVPNIVSGMMNGQPSLEGNGIASRTASFAGGAVTGAASMAVGGMGYMKATAAQAAGNVNARHAGGSGIEMGPNGSWVPASGTKASKREYMAEFGKQLYRQSMSRTPWAKALMRGANQALYQSEDSRNLRSGNYKRTQQRNRNN